MSLKFRLAGLLYKNAFPLYKPMYFAFKRRQDKFEISLLRKYIRPGDTVLDIGANIGFYAGILSNSVGPGGTVHCFEPDGQNFIHLKKIAGQLPNVRLINKAVSGETGKLKIYISKDLNVDHRTYRPEKFEREVEIEAVSVDDYVSDAGVDFIKMDIQGFEMQALKGMDRTLKSNPDIKLLSEFWPYGLRKAGGSATAYYKALKEYGFRCQLLEKNSLKRLDDELARKLDPLPESQYFNILATRTDV